VPHQGDSPHRILGEDDLDHLLALARRRYSATHVSRDSTRRLIRRIQERGPIAWRPEAPSGADTDQVGVSISLSYQDSGVHAAS
jgi:hypothetical protein